MKSDGRGAVDYDSGDEVHPLDQDYTQTISSEKWKFRVPQGNVLRAGIVCFLMGLVLLLVTASLLGIFSGTRSLEAGGSFMHRVSGVLILVGGVLILVGYRLRAMNVRRRSIGRQFWHRGRGKLGLLLLANVLCWPVCLFLVYLIGLLLSPSLAFWPLAGGGTALVACLAMGAILHRGWWQGYCVGVFVAFVLFISLGVLGNSRYRRNSSFISEPAVQAVLLMQFSGMVGAFYAMVHERKQQKARDRSNDAMVDVV
ncbi:MAG TPA: hypothetical protein DEF45_19570 [Rhodopirellula sp.]|nr:MAG: hypothetical protein CBD74_08350 [Saprospirales bacterium TMED214]HBV65213.1 hypothetical protein [Rhodopirellula sp.]